MKTKSFLELADVKAIAAAAEAEALKNNWAVTIAISDDAGNLLWLQRLDGAAALSSHIAPAKAHTAAMGRRESKVYEDIINGGRTAFLTAPLVEGLLEGGVPIVKDGHVIGAVGVSGVKSNEDAQIAKAGIAGAVRRGQLGACRLRLGGRRDQCGYGDGLLCQAHHVGVVEFVDLVGGAPVRAGDGDEPGDWRRQQHGNDQAALQSHESASTWPSA